MSKKDQLFMLKPGFFQGSEGPLYCSDSVSIEGMLSFFPDLRQKIDVLYIDVLRPRQILVEQIGENNQSAPVLILDDNTKVMNSAVPIMIYEGRRFINNPDHIARFMSSQYGVPSAS